APLTKMLEELDRAITAAGAQPPGGTRERLPRPVLESLEQQHLAAGRGDRDPRRHDLRVVDDEERPLQLLGQLGAGGVAAGAGPAPVEEEARRVAAVRRMLRDQLRRQLVVELEEFHPTAVVPSASWTWTRSPGRSSASRTPPPAVPTPPPSTRRCNGR